MATRLSEFGSEIVLADKDAGRVEDLVQDGFHAIEMDADVISLEAARSDMTITADLARAGYPNEVGPGVWDIHSPRVPSAGEIEDRLRAAASAFPAGRLWVNPDCGLKTRGYPETLASLTNLVTAASRVRSQL